MPMGVINVYVLRGPATDQLKKGLRGKESRGLCGNW